MTEAAPTAIDTHTKRNPKARRVSTGSRNNTGGCES